MSLNLQLVLIMLVCFAVCVASPTGKRPRIEACVVQTDLFKGAVTPCDGGDLQTFSDLTNTPTPQGESFGAGNLAELLLARSGIFDDQMNLERLHICSHHRNTLGAGWTQVEGNKPTFRKNSRVTPRCNVPSLEGYPHEEHQQYVIGDKLVQLAQSKGLWLELATFVPPGTGNDIGFSRSP